MKTTPNSAFTDRMTAAGLWLCGTLVLGWCLWISGSWWTWLSNQLWFGTVLWLLSPPSLCMRLKGLPHEHKISVMPIPCSTRFFPNTHVRMHTCLQAQSTIPHAQPTSPIHFQSAPIINPFINLITLNNNNNSKKTQKKNQHKKPTLFSIQARFAFHHYPGSYILHEKELYAHFWPSA